MLTIFFVVVSTVIIYVLTYGGGYQKLKHGDDPCFGRFAGEKGPVYSIKQDRVCIEYKRGVDHIYMKTLEGVEPSIFDPSKLQRGANDRYFYDN